MSFNITFFNVTLCFEEYRDGNFEEVLSEQKDIMSSFNIFGKVLDKYRHRLLPGYRCQKVVVSNESKHGPWVEIGSGLDEHGFVLSKADSRTYIRFEIQSTPASASASAPASTSTLLPSTYLEMLSPEAFFLQSV